MQINDQNDSQLQKSSKEQEDISSYPLPIRIKHPSWSARKNTYQQILYYLKTIASSTQEILISGASYTVQSLLPYFQNLIQQKHAGVLLKGLQCVEQILVLDKKAYSKHCVKSLVDKGVEYFPLLSQQRKAILEKFLDVLELCKIEAAFLKNKLNLPHEKSVMYVIEVIGVLNVVSLKGVLVNLSKKHQKKCVRQLALQIAQELQQSTQNNEETEGSQYQAKLKQTKPSIQSSKQSKQSTSNDTSSCKYTIEKLPHYEQLPSKKQQQYSGQLAEKIQAIIDEYTLAQLPNFSHILRLMIDDNNHIINMNGIKCLIAIFEKEKQDLRNSLIPVSFPLLFIFKKFKSHKTHPINSLLLSLIESILQSTSNRLNDLFLAICEGLTSAGSKANVKFGCALSFFRIVALLYPNEDLYACTTNENVENENEDMNEKFVLFGEIKIGKNLNKTVEKIIGLLEKEKKYETEMYLIRYAIGLDNNNVMSNTGSSKDLVINSNKSTVPKFQSTSKSKASQTTAYKSKKTIEANNFDKNKKPEPKNQQSRQKPTALTDITQNSTKTLALSKTLKPAKSLQKFEQINLELTLNSILKLLSQQIPQQKKPPTFNQISQLLQRSSQEFYQCVKQKRYQMFYLCQLLEHFIDNYQPDDSTIEHVSQYLISLLKIVSLLKPMTSVTSDKFREISMHNVSQLLLVALCKLVISEEIQQVLENINQNYGFQIMYECLEGLFVDQANRGRNRIKKKNKKFLLEWLEGNTPAMYLNQQYYQLVQVINEKEAKKSAKSIPTAREDAAENNKNSDKNSSNNPQSGYSSSQRHRPHSPQPSSPKPHLKPQQNPLNPAHNPPTTNRSPLSSNKKHAFFSQELQNINLSKIQKNYTQANDYEEDLQKSSFHQNLEEHLRQIRTHRSCEQEENYGSYNNPTYNQINTDRTTFNNNEIDDGGVNASRQYLKQLNVEQFRKKEAPNDRNKYDTNDEQLQTSNILESSPFKSNQQYNFHPDPKQQQLSDLTYSHKTQQQNIEDDYEEKFQEVERRRLQRQKERREFMNRMKHEFKPVMGKGGEEERRNGEEQSDGDGEQRGRLSDSEEDRNGGWREGRDGDRLVGRQQMQVPKGNDEHFEESHLSEEQQRSYHNSQNSVYENRALKDNYLNERSIYHNKPSQLSSQSPQQKVSTSIVSSSSKPQFQQPDCSFVSSTSSGQFKYKELNQEKLSYMLKSTSNPYQHLRTLVLIPFKGSSKKHHFLKELLHFFTNHVEFKIPQPYTSLILLTIIMFSEIKEDKSLIQPLQSLYQFLARQSTTNDFIKTIITLFHTAIEQTHPQNRKFLITILLKSMIRMLPFIEDGLSLLRDIQQFYQIGEMVYFQMFEEEYTQIRNYIEEEAVHIVVEKAMHEEGSNLTSIVEGWLMTAWKVKVLETIAEFQEEQHSGVHDQHEGHGQEEEGYSQQHQQNYQSYI